jgi:glycosyltransferase involved in cell wall biosynthesis
MKILVFSKSFFPLSETFIYHQVIGLSENNDVTLLSFSFVNGDLFPSKNKKISAGRYINKIDEYCSRVLQKLFGIFTLHAVTKGRLKGILQKEAPDVIHAHYGFAALLIFPVAKALDIPLVVSFHGIDASPALLKKSWYSKELKRLFEYSKAIIVVSPHMVDNLQLNTWRHKVHFIPYGIDTDKFSNNIPAKKNNKNINILHSGRIISKKGVPDLIKTFIRLTAQHTNISLWILGEGKELVQCKKIVSDLKCKSVHFLGAQPPEMVKKYMSEADIFVLNSRISPQGDMEGTPVSLLEAMSMGLPVVSTLHAGIPFVVRSGVNGILVEEKNNDALGAALTSLITDHELRKELGKNARQTIQTDYGLKGMQHKINRVINS